MRLYFQLQRGQLLIQLAIVSNDIRTIYIKKYFTNCMQTVSSQCCEKKKVTSDYY